jgi:hypothetical protein
VFLMAIVIATSVVDFPKAATYLVEIWLFSDITNALMAIPKYIAQRTIPITLEDLAILNQRLIEKITYIKRTNHIITKNKRR